MSLIHSQTATCPVCAAEQEVECADSVSADRRPDLRDAILDESFQRFLCQSCGAKARLSPTLTYLDVERRQWILTLPAADRPHWDSFEQGALDIFANSFGADAPRRIRDLGATLAVRVTFGWCALREKLLGEQLGVADADLELLKLLLMRSIAADGVSDATSLRLIGQDPAGALLIAWVEDATDLPGEVFTVPRDLLDDIRSQGTAWDKVRAELTSGPFVDVTKMLVEPELPVAD